MKNNVFTTDVAVMQMPLSSDVKAWGKYFAGLMAADPVAAGRVTYYYYCIIHDYEPALPGQDNGKYYDIAIEISADDRYPANEAAVSTGFIQEGIRQMTIEVDNNGPLAKMFMPVLCGAPKKNVMGGGSKVPIQSGEDDVSHWIECMEREMMVDINAHSIITGYYLSAKVGRHCSIFAPLGYAPYKKIGEKMAKDPIVLEAAKKSGLLVSGISTFMEAALSNDGCWEGMIDGVEFLLNAPDLRNYIPFRYRYIAEGMLCLNDVIESGKQTWDEIYEKLASELSDEWAHGY